MKIPIRFDLIDLRLFQNVAEAASITHGASRSNMALASASERIRAMEVALGTPLLERRRRRVDLTPAGTALLHHARLITLQLERMRGELTDYAAGLRGRVRLFSNTAAMTEFLPEALVAFLRAHPAVDIDLEERPSGEIVRAVANSRADLGIVADAVEPAAELETFPFAVDRLVLVTPRRHTLARRRKIAFRDTFDDDFVGSSGALQRHLDDQAVRCGHRLRLRIRLAGFDAICRMVEMSVGIAIMPETAARRGQAAMAVKIVPLTDPWALRHLTLCVRSIEMLSPQARHLVDHLRNSAAPRPKPS